MKHRTEDYHIAYKAQKNYCNRLYKRDKKKYYSNLNINDVLDNKKFWNITKPFLQTKIQKIVILL